MDLSPDRLLSNLNTNKYYPYKPFFSKNWIYIVGHYRCEPLRKFIFTIFFLQRFLPIHKFFWKLWNFSRTIVLDCASNKAPAHTFISSLQFLKDKTFKIYKQYRALANSSSNSFLWIRKSILLSSSGRLTNVSVPILKSIFDIQNRLVKVRVLR